MSRLIVVTGQSGAGKDFLVEQARPADFGVDHASWGDMFGKHAGRHKDIFTPLPDAPETMAIQEHVVQEVLARQPAVITSHPAKIIDGKEYVNWDIERRLAPQHYLFVAADPAIIAERVKARNQAQNRHAPELSIEEITALQDRKLEMMRELAEYVCTELIVIQNTEENLENNIAQIQSLFAKLSMNGDYNA